MNDKMNVTLPDNRVPIRIGDPSFIYEGVYHPIVWIGQEPYRPRVELLLVKDKRYVFLQKLEENHSGENENYPYRIPGGSIDPDSNKLQQAINETNEEALKGVKNAIDPGVQYYEQYKPGFLDTHQFPIEYTGTINDVFVGEWDGRNIPDYQVEEKDRDKEMATKGKFHAVSVAASYLRTEHLRALIASGKLDKDVDTVCKIELARVRGYQGVQTTSDSYKAIRTIAMESLDPVQIPGGKLYHGTDMKIDLFHPMSLDLGNIHQEPGWSTFCFANRLLALRFGIMRVLQRVTKEYVIPSRCVDKWKKLEVKWSIRHGKPFCNGHRVNVSMFKNDSVYLYTFEAGKLKEIGVGNDSKLQEYTFRDDNVTPDAVEEIPITKDLLLEHLFLCQSDEEYEAMVKDEEALIDEYSRGAYAAMLNRDYNANSDVSKVKWDIKQGELNPGDNVTEFMREKGYDLFEIGYITGFNTEMGKKTLPDIPVEEASGANRTVSLTPELVEELKKKYSLPMLKHLRTPDATNKGYAMFTADDDLVGVVMYDKTSSYVTALEVVPKYQSSGYGNYLLQQAIHDGAKKLTVTNSNKAAIKLYEKAGFKTVSSERGRTVMTMEGRALTKKERENIPLKDYGLPDKRKYPMPDKKHVRAAIRFFNYVEKEDEKKLANAINRKIKEYGMEEEIKVGEDNRFSAYYKKPVAETMVLPVDALNTLRDFLEEKNPDFLELIKNHQNDVIFYDELDAGVSGVTGVILVFQTEPGVGEVTVLIPEEGVGFGLANTLLNNFFQHCSLTEFEEIHWDIIDREENQELFDVAREYQFREVEYVDGYRRFVFTPQSVLTESYEWETAEPVERCEVCRSTVFQSYAITNQPKEPSFEESWYDSLASAIQNYPLKEDGVYFVWAKAYNQIWLLGTCILLANDWEFHGWKTCHVIDTPTANTFLSKVDLECSPAKETMEALKAVLTRPIAQATVTEDASGNKWLNCSNPLPVLEFSGQPRHLYMVSKESDLDGRTVTPGVNKAGYRRLCFYRSIDNALLDAQEDITDQELFVYTPHPAAKFELYRPTVVEVPQVVQTGEMWITKPTKLTLVGAIRINGKRNTPPRSYLRGNEVCTLYDWDWAWIEQVTEEISFTIGGNRKAFVIDWNNTLPREYHTLTDEAASWDYGYIHQGKKYYSLDTDEDLKRYRIMTPKEVKRYHIGTCFDMTLYMADALRKMDDVKNGKYELRCYYMDAKVGKKIPCHAFPVLFERATGKYYVLETAWKSMAGVHTYRNEKDFVKRYLYQWLVDNKIQATNHYHCYTFNPALSLTGLSCFEFMIICGQYPASDSINDIKSVAESMILSIGFPVMEADTEEEGDAPGATDYTSQQGGNNPLSGGADDGAEEDTAGEENAEGDTPEDDGSGDMDAPEGTDYTEGSDDLGMGDDSGGEEGATEDSTSSDMNSGGDSGETDTNTLVKNYSLIKDFEKMYSLIDDINKTIDATLKASPLENQVLAQVSRNLTDTKNFITSFLQFHFKNNDHTFNLYYYMIVVQILKLNLKMLEDLPALSGKKD